MAYDDWSSAWTDPWAGTDYNTTSFNSPSSNTYSLPQSSYDYAAWNAPDVPSYYAAPDVSSYYAAPDVSSYYAAPDAVPNYANSNIDSYINQTSPAISNWYAQQWNDTPDVTQLRSYTQPVDESGNVYSGYTDGVPAAESGTSWLGQKAGDLMSGAGDVITHPVSTLEAMGRWMRDNPNAASLGAGAFSLIPAYFANKQNRKYQDEQLRLAQEARAAKQAATASDRVRLADIMSAKSDPRVRKAATVGTHYARSGSATPGEVEHFSNNAPSIVRAASGGSVSDGCPHCGGLAAYARGGSLGQADDVPAMLSHGEFVVPADVVAHLGDGNNEAGAVKLHRMMSGVRQQKISGGTKLPPVAKDPMAYMKGKKNG